MYEGEDGVGGGESGHVHRQEIVLRSPMLLVEHGREGSVFLRVVSYTCRSEATREQIKKIKTVRYDMETENGALQSLAATCSVNVLRHVPLLRCDHTQACFLYLGRAQAWL